MATSTALSDEYSIAPAQSYATHIRFSHQDRPPREEMMKTYSPTDIPSIARAGYRIHIGPTCACFGIHVRDLAYKRGIVFHSLENLRMQPEERCTLHELECPHRLTELFPLMDIFDCDVEGTLH